mgnify:CR=1 FL=1
MSLTPEILALIQQNSAITIMQTFVDSVTKEYYQGSARRPEDPSVPYRPDEYHSWDFENGQWFIDPELKWNEIREERAKRMAAVLWRIDRHNQQVALNVTPSEDITPVLQYVQALRDLPQSEQDPFNLTWPVEP